MSRGRADLFPVFHPLKVASRLLRPRDMDRRVAAFSHPDDADTHAATGRAGTLDFDRLDWRKVLTDSLGGKFNALRRREAP